MSGNAGAMRGGFGASMGAPQQQSKYRDRSQNEQPSGIEQSNK